MIICPFCRTTIDEQARKCPNCWEWLGPAPSVETDSKDRQELAERRMTDSVESRIEKNLLKRYSWIGLVVAALTGGTITLLVHSSVEETLRGTRTNLAAAEALQARSNKSLDALDESLQRLKLFETRLASLSAQAANTEQKYTQLAALSDSMRRGQYNLSTDILKITAELDRKIKALTKEAKPAMVAAAAPVSDQTLITAALVRAAKRQYVVQITPMPSAPNLINALLAQGYSASEYATGGPLEPESNQAIWLGKDVSFVVAIEVIRIGLEHFPSLSFVAVYGEHPELQSTDVDKVIYLGGSTERAKRQKLTPFSAEELTLLLNSKTHDEFRAQIRAHYQKS